VSVEPSKTLSSGFLREFHFSTLAQGVLNGLLGEVKQPPWMKFVVSHSPDVLTRTFVFAVQIRIEAHVLPRGDLWKWGPRIPHNRTFAAEFRVPDSVIREFRERLPDLCIKGLESSLLSGAYRLYEIDPRIGWRWGSNGDCLPVSKLFDPPGMFSRTGFPAGVEAREVPRCPFCGALHQLADPPIWAGGNLMWVHEACWRSVCS